jgi:hypothetical protein
MRLAKYAGREGFGFFRSMTLDEAKHLRHGETVWFLTVSGDARRAKVNGAPKTWKRDASRIEVPIKYGMYECSRLTAADVHRLLVEQDDPMKAAERQGDALASVGLSPETDA